MVVVQKARSRPVGRVRLAEAGRRVRIYAQRRAANDGTALPSVVRCGVHCEAQPQQIGSRSSRTL